MPGFISGLFAGSRSQCQQEFCQSTVFRFETTEQLKVASQQLSGFSTIDRGGGKRRAAMLNRLYGLKRPNAGGTCSTPAPGRPAL